MYIAHQDLWMQKMGQEMQLVEIGDTVTKIQLLDSLVFLALVAIGW